MWSNGTRMSMIFIHLGVCKIMLVSYVNNLFVKVVWNSMLLKNYYHFYECCGATCSFHCPQPPFFVSLFITHC